MRTHAKRPETSPSLLVASSLVAIWLAGCAASAPYSARLVDTSGAALPTTNRHGRAVTIGQSGQAYEIEVTNRTAVPVAVEIAVDGLDVWNGHVVDVNAGCIEDRGGYELEADSFNKVRGFQVAANAISTFRFTSPERALASDTTKGGNMADRVRGTVDVVFCALKSRYPDASTNISYTSRENVSSPAASLPRDFGTIVAVGDTDQSRHATTATTLWRVTIAYEADAHDVRLGTAGPPPEVVVPETEAPPLATTEPPQSTQPTQPTQPTKPTKPTKEPRQIPGSKDGDTTPTVPATQRKLPRDGK